MISDKCVIATLLVCLLSFIGSVYKLAPEPSTLFELTDQIAAQETSRHQRSKPSKLTGQVAVHKTSLQQRIEPSELTDQVAAHETSLQQRSTCISEGDRCEDDCECCGFLNPEDFPGQSSRCETRYKGEGRRCYLCSWLGKSCEKHSDCCSQHCYNNVCHGAHIFHKNPCYETVIASAIPVSGSVIGGDDVCPCSDLSTDQIYSGVENSIDKNTTTEYTNNYPINSGIIAYAPYHHAPVRKLLVCTNTACLNCDPTCYNLEGLCETDEDEWEFIQSGDLGLNTDRESCTEVPIIGRHQYSQYKITFPCIRGGWSECSGTPGAAPGPKEEWKPVQGQKKPVECQDSVKKLKNMEMTFIETSYNSETDLTAFVYDFDNVLSHFTTDFWGDCEFAEYEYYLVNDDNGEVVYTGTPVLNVEEDDPDLCIKGAEFDTGGQVIYPHFHYRLAVKVKGQVSSVTGTYGIFQTPNWALYGEVEVPSCPVPPSCENYPMIVSEIDLLGKCNEVE